MGNLQFIAHSRRDKSRYHNSEDVVRRMTYLNQEYTHVSAVPLVKLKRQMRAFVAGQGKKNAYGYGYPAGMDVFAAVMGFDKMDYMSEEEVEELFVEWDVEQKGIVNFFHLIASLTLVCKATFMQKARALFRMTDVADKGYITLDECVRIVHFVCHGLCTLVGERDHPTQLEVTKYVHSHLFAKLDLVRRKTGLHSPQVTKEHFLEWVVYDAMAVQLLCMYGTTDADQIKKHTHQLQSYSQREVLDRKVQLPSIAALKLSSVRAQTSHGPRHHVPLTRPVHNHHISNSLKQIAEHKPMFAQSEPTDDDPRKETVAPKRLRHANSIARSFSLKNMHQAPNFKSRVGGRSKTKASTQVRGSLLIKGRSERKATERKKRGAFWDELTINENDDEQVPEVDPKLDAIRAQMREQHEQFGSRSRVLARPSVTSQGPRPTREMHQSTSVPLFTKKSVVFEGVIPNVPTTEEKSQAQARTEAGVKEEGEGDIIEEEEEEGREVVYDENGDVMTIRPRTPLLPPKPVKKRYRFDIRKVRRVKTLFESLERTKDGKLTPMTLAGSMKHNRFLPPNMNIFSSLDTDKDGTVGIKELLRAFYPTASEGKLKAMVFSVSPPPFTRKIVLAFREFFRDQDHFSTGHIQFGPMLAELRHHSKLHQYVENQSFPYRLRGRMVTFREFMIIILKKTQPENEKDWHKVLTQCPNYILTSAQHAEIETLFHQYDNDYSGLITLDEIIAHAVSRLGFEEAEMTRMFKNMDLDDNGGVDLDEFKKFFSYIYGLEQDMEAEKRSKHSGRMSMAIKKQEEEEAHAWHGKRTR
jgi:Ca2+-binding EF-hand superfamily protein